MEAQALKHVVQMSDHPVDPNYSYHIISSQTVYNFHTYKPCTTFTPSNRVQLPHLQTVYNLHTFKHAMQDVRLVSVDTGRVPGHWLVQLRRKVETCDPEVREGQRRRMQ